jgi:hypothetical protein
VTASATAGSVAGGLAGLGAKGVVAKVLAGEEWVHV